MPSISVCATEQGIGLLISKNLLRIGIKADRALEKGGYVAEVNDGRRTVCILRTRIGKFFVVICLEDTTVITVSKSGYDQNLFMSFLSFFSACNHSSFDYLYGQRAFRSIMNIDCGPVASWSTIGKMPLLSVCCTMWDLVMHSTCVFQNCKTTVPYRQ